MTVGNKTVNVAVNYGKTDDDRCDTKPNPFASKLIVNRLVVNLCKTVKRCTMQSWYYFARINEEKESSKP